MRGIKTTEAQRTQRGGAIAVYMKLAEAPVGLLVFRQEMFFTLKFSLCPLWLCGKFPLTSHHYR
jgi:hypothetical protein